MIWKMNRYSNHCFKQLSFIALRAEFFHSSRILYAPRRAPIPINRSPEALNEKRKLFQENTRRILQDSLSFVHYEQEIEAKIPDKEYPLESTTQPIATQIVEPRALQQFLIDNGALNICIIDMNEKSCPIPWMIIVECEHARKRRALANLLCREYANIFPDIMFDAGERFSKDDEWIAMNLGQILIHIMSPEARGIYKLEELWTEQTINLNDIT